MSWINKSFLVGLFLCFVGINNLNANEDVSINDLKEITYFLLKDVKELNVQMDNFLVNLKDETSVFEESLKEKVYKDLMILNKNMLTVDKKLNELLLKNYTVDNKLIEYQNK